MDSLRIKRYKDKRDHLLERKSELEDWKEDSFTDTKTMLACYKAFQEMVEAAMDILAMAVKDSNAVPKDDYSNCDFAYEKKILTKQLAEKLKEANGLRNRVIHAYNGLNKERARDSFIALLPSFDDFIELINVWIKKH